MSFKATSIPTKTLTQNLSSTALALYLSDTLSWDGGQLSSDDFGTQAWAVLRNASNSQIEFVEIDPATVAAGAPITILKRGLGYDGATIADAETAYDWNAFDTYVELGADTPQLLQALKNYIDNIAIAGTVFATTALSGVAELATQAETDAGDAVGGSGGPLIPTTGTLRGKLYNDYAVDSVGTDAYAITVTPAITAYAAGQIFSFKAGTLNTAGATLAVSGLAAKAIKKNYNQALVTGDILAGQMVLVQYDSANDCFQLLSKTPNVAPTTQVITATGVWTKPANLKYAVIEVVGGGGGGVIPAAFNRGGGGGGGGGYSKKIVAAASLGATEIVTVGVENGTTSFGSHCQATGGSDATAEIGGAGGVGSGGDLNIAGSAGGSALGTSSGTFGGAGGPSHLGGGGAGGATRASASSEGAAGGNYGGGGGGGAAGTAQAPISGGGGAAGVIIVTEYYS